MSARKIILGLTAATLGLSVYACGHTDNDCVALDDCIVGETADDGSVSNESAADTSSPSGDAAADAPAIDGEAPDATTSADSGIDATEPVDATQPVDVTEPMDVQPPVDASLDVGPPPACTCGTTCPALASANATFVSATLSSGATGCGAITAPCPTIAAGLAAASANGAPLVYVDEGTYTENVTLPSGIVLRGGWQDLGTGWAQSCAADPSSLAVIVAPATSNVTITANGVTAGLDTLTVKSKATANAGESLYGVFAYGANLSLTAVDIVVAAGGNGAPGGTGTAPSNGPTPPCAAGGGASPGSGSSGAPGVAAYSGTGYTPGTGATGAPGAAGEDGTGAATTCELSGAGPTHCTNGPCDSGAECVCNTVGASGCGGPGGGPGTGGGGGGASIGIFAWGSDVQVEGGSLSAGNGGNGGEAGTGTAGASSWPSSAGGTGSSASYQGDCVAGGTAPHLTCDCTPETIPAGGPGGNGARGAQGGNGGCGSGGDSYGYYAGSAATVTGTFPTATFGSAGTSPCTGGGAGNAGVHN